VCPHNSKNPCLNTKQHLIIPIPPSFWWLMSSTWCIGRSLLVASRTLKTTPTPTPTTTTKTIITSSTLKLNPNPTSTRFFPYRTRLTHSSPPFLMAAARVSNEGGDDVVRFPLSPSAALVIQKGDITKWFVDSKTDAIVSASLSLSLSLFTTLFMYIIYDCANRLSSRYL